MHLLFNLASLLLCVLSPSAAQSNRPRYNVYTLPPFEIRLDVDLWTTVLNGSYLSRNKAQRSLEPYDSITDDTSSSEEDPAYALSSLKYSLSQAVSHKDDSTSDHLPSYLLALLTEYTTSYLSTFLHSAFDTEGRAEKGWSLVHALDLSGEWVDVGFFTEEVHYLDGETRRLNEEEETFASLTVAFSGTAAILQGKNVDSSTSTSDQPDALLASPQIDRSLLRLAVNTAFYPPDGPYQFLSHVITNSMEDRLYSVPGGEMRESQIMEHDAALVLSGGREVKTRMDLDLNPDAEFVSVNSAASSGGYGIFGWINRGQVEKRESLAVFLQGAFLVLFIGGFYIYASVKYRKNHLKWQMKRLIANGSKDAILFKHKYKRPRGQRFAMFVSGLQRSRSKDNHSPVTVEIDGVDGFFERELSGVDSSDEDMYDFETEEQNSYCEEPQDLEKGLRESYDESNRFKKGLDMNPIDEQSITNRRSSVMKATDDDTSTTTQPPVVDWNEVLENVVPIPAADAVGKLDDHNATYHIASQNGSVLVQRRYVQPASPFDVLYGAAFLHGEADRVEAQRRLTKPQKKKIRASPSGRMRKKKKKTLTMQLVTEAMNGQRSKDAIKPMMTIAEVEGGIQEVFDEEEEDAYGSEEENDDSAPDLAQFTPGELRHNPSPMSFYSPGNFMRNLSEKYNLGLFEQPSEGVGGFHKADAAQDEKKCEDIVHEDYPVEEGVVFRDFPRQDGTPCIIYNVKEQEAKVDEQSTDPPAVKDFLIDSGKYEILEDEANTTIDLSGDDHLEVQDDFASKMSRILDSKCKQIEERKAMELEMQARRREREERRRQAAESTSNELV